MATRIRGIEFAIKALPRNKSVRLRDSKTVVDSVAPITSPGSIEGISQAPPVPVR